MTVIDATTATTSSSSEQWRSHALPEDAADWVKELELGDAACFAPPGAIKTHKPRVLVLYGSLRDASFSRLTAYECARVLEHLGADVRVFDPRGLPVRDPAVEKTDTKMHGTITGVMKNQIDWIPPSAGSVRPTQGKTVAVMQVNGDAQSFNAVNALRLLARWMRMPCCTNQSSVPKAWQEFEGGRMKPSGSHDRVVDVMEEFYKFTVLLRKHAEFLVDRFSERKERESRLLAQVETEATEVGKAAATLADSSR